VSSRSRLALISFAQSSAGRSTRWHLRSCRPRPGRCLARWSADLPGPATPTRTPSAASFAHPEGRLGPLAGRPARLGSSVGAYAWLGCGCSGWLAGADAGVASPSCSARSIPAPPAGPGRHRPAASPWAASCRRGRWRRPPGLTSTLRMAASVPSASPSVSHAVPNPPRAHLQDATARWDRGASTANSWPTAGSQGKVNPASRCVAGRYGAAQGRSCAEFYPSRSKHRHRHRPWVDKTFLDHANHSGVKVTDPRARPRVSRTAAGHSGRRQPVLAHGSSTPPGPGSAVHDQHRNCRSAQSSGRRLNPAASVLMRIGTPDPASSRMSARTGSVGVP
jgi:hypothetical protein